MVKWGPLTRNRPIDINMYTTNNNSASEFIKQRVAKLKGGADKFTVMVEDFKCHSVNDRTSRLNFNKYEHYLENTTNHLKLHYIYRTLHRTAAHTCGPYA